MLNGLYVTEPNTLIIPSGAPDLLDSEFWGICEIDGLGRPDAATYTADKVGSDASFWSGLSVKSRKITLSVDAQSDIYKMQLYKALGYGDKRRMFFETDAGIFWIDGYVTGMKYTSDASAISEFEIPIFCPYPWFRSAKYHEKAITYGGDAVSVSQNGDVRAGVGLYLPSTSTGNLNYLKVSSAPDGYAIKYESSEYQHIMGIANQPILLIDTTPGNHAFLASKMVQDIAITKDWCTVPATGAVNISAQIGIWSGLNYIETANGLIRWHDTWSGI